MLPFGLARRPAIAHIGPQHAGQQKAGRYRLTLAHAPVGILQSSGDKRMVGALHHQIEQGINAALQPELAQLRNRRQCMPGLQELEHFIKQAALRHIGQQGKAFAQRRCGFAVHLEAQRRQLGRKAHRADDAHRVFAVTHTSVANHLEGFVFGVFDTAVVIDQNLRLRVVVHGVDGEVAPDRVFLLRTPDVVTQDAACGVHGMLHTGKLALAGFFVACYLFGGSVI